MKRTETLDGGLLKSLAMFGMSNLDQFKGTLTEILAKQISNSILCDDKVDMCSCGDDSSTESEERNDFAFATARKSIVFEIRRRMKREKENESDRTVRCKN